MSAAKLRAARAFRRGAWAEALAELSAHLNVCPCDAQARLRVADCVLNLAGPARGHTAYTHVAHRALDVGAAGIAAVALQMATLCATQTASLPPQSEELARWAAVVSNPAHMRSVQPCASAPPAPRAPAAVPVEAALLEAALAVLAAPTQLEQPAAALAMLSELRAEDVKRLWPVLSLRRLSAGAPVFTPHEAGLWWLVDGSVADPRTGVVDTAGAAGLAGPGLRGELLAREDTDVLWLSMAAAEQLAEEVPRTARVLRSHIWRGRALDLVRTHPILRGLGEAAQATLLSRVTRRQYLDGAVMIREGEPPCGLFVITAGRATVWAGERVLAELGPGDVCGEMSWLHQRPTTAAVMAAADLEALWLPAAALDACFQAQPKDALRKLAQRRLVQNATLTAWAEDVAPQP